MTKAPGPAVGRPVAVATLPTTRDRAWQLALWAGFRAACVWWGLTRKPHEGALVAVHVGPELLLLRSSYRRDWSFPGGGVKAGEAPVEAARRELGEEVGLDGTLAGPAGVFAGTWDNRPDRVHVYELRLPSLPRLRLDNREVVEARLFAAGELDGLAVTGPVAAYLGSKVASPPSPPGDRHAGVRAVVERACRLLAAAVLALAAGCASAPPPEGQATRLPRDPPACQAAGTAKGIAAGFFAIVQDRPECF